MAHSKAPWNVLEGDPSDGCCWNHGIVGQPNQYGQNRIADVSKLEDARLMSASPEMFDALDSVVNLLGDTIPDELRAECYAALKKAQKEYPDPKLKEVK